MEQCSKCGEGVVAPWSGLCRSLWDCTRPHDSREDAVVPLAHFDECSPTPPDPIARAKALGWERRPSSWCVPDRSGIMSSDLWLDYYAGPRWYITHPERCPIDAGTDEADAVALALLLWDTVLM